MRGFDHCSDMELSRVGFKNPPGTSLAALESLTLPLVHEIVLSADVRCADCQKRLTNMMARLRETESVVVDVLAKTVTVIYRNCSSAEEPSCSGQVAAVLCRNVIGREVLRLVSKFGSA